MDVAGSEERRFPFRRLAAGAKLPLTGRTTTPAAHAVACPKSNFIFRAASSTTIFAA